MRIKPIKGIRTKKTIKNCSGCDPTYGGVKVYKQKSNNIHEIINIKDKKRITKEFMQAEELKTAEQKIVQKKEKFTRKGTVKNLEEIKEIEGEENKRLKDKKFYLNNRIREINKEMVIDCERNEKNIKRATIGNIEHKHFYFLGRYHRRGKTYPPEKKKRKPRDHLCLSAIIREFEQCEEDVFEN